MFKRFVMVVLAGSCLLPVSAQEPGASEYGAVAPIQSWAGVGESLPLPNRGWANDALYQNELAVRKGTYAISHAQAENVLTLEYKAMCGYAVLGIPTTNRFEYRYLGASLESAEILEGIGRAYQVAVLEGGEKYRTARRAQGGASLALTPLDLDARSLGAAFVELGEEYLRSGGKRTDPGLKIKLMEFQTRINPVPTSSTTEVSGRMELTAPLLDRIPAVLKAGVVEPVGAGARGLNGLRHVGNEILVGKALAMERVAGLVRLHHFSQAQAKELVRTEIHARLGWRALGYEVDFSINYGSGNLARARADITRAAWQVYQTRNEVEWVEGRHTKTPLLYREADHLGRYVIQLGEAYERNGRTLDHPEVQRALWRLRGRVEAVREHLWKKAKLVPTHLEFVEQSVSQRIWKALPAAGTVTPGQPEKLPGSQPLLNRSDAKLHLALLQSEDRLRTRRVMEPLNRVKSEALGFARFGGGFLLKEGVHAALEADGDRLSSALQTVRSTEFIGSALFLSTTSRIVDAGLDMGPLSRVLARSSAPIRVAVRGGVPLAVGMTALDAIHGRADWVHSTRSAAAYTVAGSVVEEVSLRWITPALRISRAPWLAVGAYEIARTAATLALGEQLERAAAGYPSKPTLAEVLRNRAGGRP